MQFNQVVYTTRQVGFTPIQSKVVKQSPTMLFELDRQLFTFILALIEKCWDTVVIYFVLFGTYLQQFKCLSTQVILRYNVCQLKGENVYA